MRIVGQNAWPVFRGGERSIALIMAGLQRRGHDVLLVCANPVVAERCAAYGIETVSIRFTGDLMLDRSYRFARLLRRFRPDAALLGTFRKVLPAAIGARAAGVPRVVCRVGISTDTPASLKYRLVFRHLVDAVVVNAAEMRAGFLAADPRLDPERVAAIRTGVVAPARIRPAGALRRELALPDGAQVIGALAYLAPFKRQHRVVRALASLPEHVHYVLAGDGPERPALEALATQLGVRHRLHLLGFRTDVGDVLAAFDLYVVSSDREGMSNAMLEALASGIPVISTPVSGAREALEPLPDGTAPGVIVSTEPADIAREAVALLADPARLRRMGSAARRRAEERFSYDRMISDYERILAPRGRRR
ncbi:MAG TPA: glycosyltransferase family 4 protein [Longimicrobiales bacterium]|nr:glycosyltransferase family 4 protein [Longimicrobiales bacterium]